MSTPYTGADKTIPLPRLRTISHLWSLAAVLSSLGVAALAFDAPLASWVSEDRIPVAARKIFGLSEGFSHGLGVVLIALFIAILDPWHRYAIPRILAASLGSGLAANLFKSVVARTRPAYADLAGSGLDSFGQWFPIWTNSSWEQSFPSSHTATAAGLAIVLACFYPRGRWLFPALAVLAGCQRISADAHFLSDVLWGGAIGCIFAPLCVYGSGLARVFDRLEERLMARLGMLRAVVQHRRSKLGARRELPETPPAAQHAA